MIPNENMKEKSFIEIKVYINVNSKSAFIGLNII